MSLLLVQKLMHKGMGMTTSRRVVPRHVRGVLHHRLMSMPLFPTAVSSPPPYCCSAAAAVATTAILPTSSSFSTLLTPLVGCYVGNYNNHSSSSNNNINITATSPPTATITEPAEKKGGVTLSSLWSSRTTHASAPSFSLFAPITTTSTNSTGCSSRRRRVAAASASSPSSSSQSAVLLLPLLRLLSSPSSWFLPTTTTKKTTTTFVIEEQRQQQLLLLLENCRSSTTSTTCCFIGGCHEGGSRGDFAAAHSFPPPWPSSLLPLTVPSKQKKQQLRLATAATTTTSPSPPLGPTTSFRRRHTMATSSTAAVTVVVAPPSPATVGGVAPVAAAKLLPVMPSLSLAAGSSRSRCFSTSTTSEAASAMSGGSGGSGGGMPPTKPQEPAFFKLDRSRNGIVVGLMNNPAKKNALSRAFMREMRESLEELRFDRDARVLVLASAVPGAFCAGADLKERRTMPADEVPKSLDEIRRTVHGFANHPLPIIAAIDGFALGGGLELALACDIRVASPAAKVGLPETKLAIIPGAGGTQRLSRIIGLAKAKELILTGRVITGDEAFKIGLVNHLVEDPLAKCLEIAQEILKTGPIASRLAKIAIDEGAQVEMGSALLIEQQCYAQTIGTKDRQEALEAFAQKRAPVFRGE